MNSTKIKNKLRSKRKLIYIIATLALITLLVVRLKGNKKTVEQKVYQYDIAQAINVIVDTLKYVTPENNSYYTGTFEPNKETKISTDIQGKIVDVLVDVGRIVKKGEALILLDNTLLKLQLQTIEVQIEGLEADVKRYEVLAKAEAIQKVQLEKAILGLKSAKLQRATLVEQINKTTIRAPFNGIVTAKLTEEGAFAAPGMPLLQIIDIKTLKFTINIPENELSKFSLNQDYQILADVYPEQGLYGKVIMVGSKANFSNSFPVLFSVKNTPDLKIKSGMFGKVSFINSSNEKHIMVPASAITGTTINPQVYLVKNKTVVLKSITVASRVQNKAIVSDGLNEGDIIVTGGLVNLFDGANVNIN